MPVDQQMYAGFGYVPTLLDVSLYASVSVCSAPFISKSEKFNRDFKRSKYFVNGKLEMQPSQLLFHSSTEAKSGFWAPPGSGVY